MWWAVVRGGVVLAWRGHVALVVSWCEVVVVVGGSVEVWVSAAVVVGMVGFWVVWAVVVAWWGHGSMLVVGWRGVGLAYGVGVVLRLGVLWGWWVGQPRGRLVRWHGPGRRL